MYGGQCPLDTPLLLRERLDALSASAGARKSIAGVPMCRFSTATSIMFTTWLTLPTAALHTAPNENEISNGATPHLVNRPTRWNIDDLYFPSQIQRNIVLCYATPHHLFVSSPPFVTLAMFVTSTIQALLVYQRQSFEKHIALVTVLKTIEEEKNIRIILSLFLAWLSCCSKDNLSEGQESSLHLKQM